MVHWLKLCTSTEEGIGSIPSQGSSPCCMVQPKKIFLLKKKRHWRSKDLGSLYFQKVHPCFPAPSGYSFCHYLYYSCYHRVLGDWNRLAGQSTCSAFVEQSSPTMSLHWSLPCLVWHTFGQLSCLWSYQSGNRVTQPCLKLFYLV